MTEPRRVCKPHGYTNCYCDDDKNSIIEPNWKEVAGRMKEALKKLAYPKGRCLGACTELANQALAKYEKAVKGEENGR